jgi:preprotein translocase subunit SecG
VVRLLRSGDQAKAIHITKAKGADHVAMLELKMLELTAYARKKATLFLNLAEANQAHLERVTIILTVAGIFLSMIIAFIATYRFESMKKCFSIKT